MRLSFWRQWWKRLVPEAEPTWSDIDSYLLLGWIWVGSRFSLAMATTIISVNSGLGHNGIGWLAPFWIFILALTVANGAVIIQRDLRQGQMPGLASLGTGALLDVCWVLGGYVMTGLDPLPFPAFIVALIALHGALLPLKWTVIFSTVIALSVAILQALNTTVGGGGLSTHGQLVFVLGLGVVAGVVGSRLRAAVWAVFRLRRAVQELTATSDATARALPLGMIVLTKEGQLERSLGRLEGACSEISLERLHQKLIQLDPLYKEALQNEDGQGEVLINEEDREAWIEWSVSNRTLPDIKSLDTTALTANLPPIIKRDLSLPQVARTVVVLRDRSDLHRADLAERSAAEARQLAAMSASLAHELRNPLAALRSAAEQLAGETNLGVEDKATLGLIVQRESERLNRFLSDFLAYARIDVSQGKVLPAHVAIQEAVDLVKQAFPETRIQKNIEAGPLLPVDLVIRVVANLLLNAAQHSKTEQAIELEARKQKEGYVISIRDYGPGIAVPEREKVFTPFYTTRVGGNGLGLSMAARATGLLGGRIWILTPPGCSDQGEGVIFKLQLPLEPKIESP